MLQSCSTGAVLSVLAADDMSKVTVHTSAALTEPRGLIEGQLGSFSRGLVLALLVLTGALAILTLLTALIAALVPAVIASRREPIRELRVP